MEFFAIERTDLNGKKYIVCKSIVFSHIYRQYKKLLNDFPFEDFRLIKVIRIN